MPFSQRGNHRLVLLTQESGDNLIQFLHLFHNICFRYFDQVTSPIPATRRTGEHENQDWAAQ